MKLFAWIFFFTFQSLILVESAGARTQNSVGAGLNVGLRGESNVRGDYEYSSAPTFSITWTMLENVRLAGDFVWYSRKTGNKTLSTENDHFEAQVWGMYQYRASARWTFLGGAGFGFFWDNITTELEGISTENSSSIKGLVGGKAKAEYRIRKNLSGQTDLRILGLIGEEEPVTMISMGLLYWFR